MDLPSVFMFIKSKNFKKTKILKEKLTFYEVKDEKTFFFFAGHRFSSITLSAHLPQKDKGSRQ